MALVSFRVALFQRWCSFSTGGSWRLVTWFPHNSTLEALVNILLQSVQVFFAVLQSAEVGWNVSIIPIVVILKVVKE